MRWSEFEHAAPELAGLIRGRFKATDLVMMATLRPNGWPRISPIEWTIFEGELVLGGMWQSKKFLDIQRDPRITLHSTTSNKDGQEGDAKLYGRMVQYPEERVEAYWQHVFEETGWRADGPAHIYTVDIVEASYIVFDGAGNMRWLTWPGGEWRSKPST